MMKYIFLVLYYLSCITYVQCQGKTWYYTGKSRNIDLSNSLYNGDTVELMSLYPSVSIKHDIVSCIDMSHVIPSVWKVYAGQILFKHSKSYCHDNNSNNDGNQLPFESVVSDIEQGYIQQLYPLTSLMTIYGVAVYDLVVGVDYGINSMTTMDEVIIRPYELEIGLFDHRKQKYERFNWTSLPLGRLVAVVLISNDSYHSQAKLMFTIDPRGKKIALVMNTKITHSNEMDNSFDISPRTSEMKVMTYNIWHNNPPTWKFPDLYDRWQRYERRMRHWAKIVVNEDVDVILLQEVRLDESFTSAYQSPPVLAASSSSSSPSDYGGQLDHVLKYLNRENRERGQNITYSCVYHPGMLQFDRMSNPYPVARIEEGLAVVSRWPIVSAEVLLLPRDFKDARDDHQRIILKATIQKENTFSDIIEVFTTHLSLSEQARIRSLEAFQRFSSRLSTELIDNNSNNINNINNNINDDTSDSESIINKLQIFGGDFNAESSEQSLRSITRNHESCKDRIYHSSKSESLPNSISDISPDDSIMTDGWDDIWCLKHGINDTMTIDEGFTFPSHIPIKRIDFLFIRNISSFDKTIPLHHDIQNNIEYDKNQQFLPSKTIHADSINIIGKEPLDNPNQVKDSNDEYMEVDTEGNANILKKAPDLLDPDGPIWASDHYGLVSNLHIGLIE